MSEQIKYPEGIRVFKPHEKAPASVVASLVVTPEDLIAYCKSNPELMTEYNGKKQLKLKLLTGNKGPYAVVDTYKKQREGVADLNKDEPSEEVPF